MDLCSFPVCDLHKHFLVCSPLGKCLYWGEFPSLSSDNNLVRSFVIKIKPYYTECSEFISKRLVFLCLPEPQSLFSWLFLLRKPVGVLWGKSMNLWGPPLKFWPPGLFPFHFISYLACSNLSKKKRKRFTAPAASDPGKQILSVTLGIHLPF